MDEVVGWAYPGTGVGDGEWPMRTGIGLLERGGMGLLEPPLGGGEGILGAFSSSLLNDGRPSLSLLIVPVGACAVFMLEYGLNLLFLSLSGVPSRSFTLSKLVRFPTSSYA